jgi:hypothetical protein
MHDHEMTELERAIAREERRDRRARQLGSPDPRCVLCGEQNPLALCGTAPDIRCYECLAQAEGRSVTEGHHVAGRQNDPDDIVPVLGNDHRVLSDAQTHEWPSRTLRNPEGSPLLAAAAAIRGWLDILRLVMDRTVGWVPGFLEALDAFLRTQRGEQWWTDIDLTDIGWGGS